MKPEDLKHNNYLQFLGKPVRVKGYYFMDRVDGVFWIKTDDYVDSKNIHFKPIPLTEEWLLKFGFEENQIICGEYIMHVSVNAFSGTLKKEPSWVISIIHVSANQKITVVKQYVHQLQNLYKALTNQELKII